MFRVYRCLLLVIVLAFAGGVALAQVATGTPPFGSFGAGPDFINLSNLNVHLTIPVLHKAGRGIPFEYDLVYDSSVWKPGGGWRPVSNWGWASSQESATGTINYYGQPIKCFADGAQDFIYYAFFYADPYGVTHVFSFSNGSGNTPLHQDPYCGASNTTAIATDGSGLKIRAWSGGGSIPVNVAITNPSGLVFIPVIQGQSIGTVTKTDRNGNQISLDTHSVFTDTLGTAALTVSGLGTPASPTKLTYTAPSGAAVFYQVNYTSYTVATNFGLSGIAEYGPTAISLITSVGLPDGSQYSFAYEHTPSVPSTGVCTPLSGTYNGYCVTARLASVTLPTGGAIIYSYSGGNNGILSDGSAATLTRQTLDGTWKYAQVKGTGAASTTTITDPSTAANATVIQFQGLYETQRDSYQGAASPSNLLQTIKTCYNNNTTNCTATAVTLPITQRNIFTILPSNQQSEHDDFWNTYGGPTKTDYYDYGAAPHGPLLKKVLASYALLGNITGFRQTVTIQNGSGATVSKIKYNYDEGTRTATSGTPQLLNVSAPWGNLTSTNMYTSSGTLLTKSTTYYDTGNEKTTTDVNGGVTTFNYASGAASCYNSFPTSITEAITTLSTANTWNCTGGVQLTSTDQNSKTTTTAYTDVYFWRPASSTDATGAITNFCYGLLTSGTCVPNPNQTESTLNFNSGSSTVDTLTTVDGLGRLHVQQTRQSPNSSNFDSAETDYDALGRASRITLPYIGTAGQTNSSVASTSTTYDAMSRPLTILDGGG